MKQLTFIIISFLYSFITEAAYSVHTPTIDSNYLNTKKTSIYLPNSNNLISIKQKKLTIKKQGFLKNVFSFCLKYKFFKPVNKNKNDFSLGGLLLGILLAPIGVASAYLTTKNKKVRKWAVVGCIADIGLAMLFIFIVIFVTTF